MPIGQTLAARHPGQAGAIGGLSDTALAVVVGTLTLADGKATAKWEFTGGTGRFANLTGGTADMVADNDLTTGAFTFSFAKAHLSLA